MFAFVAQTLFVFTGSGAIGLDGSFGIGDAESIGFGVTGSWDGFGWGVVVGTSESGWLPTFVFV
jgi:hypothetical protein